MLSGAARAPDGVDFLDDLRFGNAFADVGQLEFEPCHQSAMTFSSARFMRLGPGK